MPTISQLVRSDRTLIVAHRGDSKVAPENTLPAFRSALDVGVDLIELDTHDSADGVPMVIHDKTLDRTTNARARWQGEQIMVSSKTAEELAELDAGGWYDSKFVGTRLSTLAATMEVVLPRSMLMIERKSDSVDNCLQVIRQQQALDRVTVHAFDWGFVAEAHRAEPKLVLGALGSKEFEPRKAVEAASIGATILNWKAADLTRDAIAAAHDQGLRVWAWTVDDPIEARRLVAAGIDALISNLPARIKQVVREASGK